MEEEFCDKCGASLKKYWHKLTPGLVRTLVKVYERVNEKGENKIHKNELTLTHGEYGNFQKLRFHALIAKYKENGEYKSGMWLITRRGAQFLTGQISVPESVQTFRNKVVGHSIEEVSVADIIGRRNEPYFQTDFAFTLATEEDLEQVPAVKRIKKSRKKAKNPCPTCGGETKLITKPLETNGNTVTVEQWRECQNCGAKIHV